MFSRSFGWFICLSVTVAVATNYSHPDSFTDSTTEPVKVVVESTANNLGDLLDAGDGAVVTLVAGDARLVAHRAVLSARSPVLAAMLGDGGGEVSVPDVEGPVLRHLLAYMYTLQAPQLPSMAPQLLAAADKYGLSALKEACQQQMASQLSVETAADTAVFAIRNSYASLSAAAIAFLKAHIFDVLATQGWANLVHKQPGEFVEVSRLLSEPLPERSAPATAGSAATTAATQAYSDGSQTPAPAAPPTAALNASSPDDTAFAYLRNISAEEKGKKLIQAAMEGAVEDIEALLAAGTDVGARDGNKYTALHWAAFWGHVEAVRRLLAAGAEVDARSMWQRTPLHRAAYFGHTAVVRLLLAASADPNATDGGGWTPLHDAAFKGRAEAATALLQAGADKGIKSNEGHTPLDLARKHNHQQLVDILK